MEEWDFEDNECWTSPNPELLMFDGVLDGERFVFAISQVALNDFYRTADTPDDAVNNYLNNSGAVEGVAVQFAREFEPNREVPHYLISSNEFRRLA